MPGAKKHTPGFDPSTLTHTVRPVRFLELWRNGGWAVKMYGISTEDERPPPMLVDTAREIAVSCLPHPPLTEERYGTAFVIVHEAPAFFNTVIVDWWERVNELRHHVFRAQPEAPTRFHEITASGEAACVWELRVQAFEREAWLLHVLQNEGGPDLDGYLAQGFSGNV